MLIGPDGIVSVEKGGQKLEARAERGGAVTWLGEMPFELGREAPTADGLYERKGRTYFFFIENGKKYAEVAR